MNYLIVFLLGVLLGAISAVLAYRNNQAKVEAEAKKLADDAKADAAKVQAVVDALKK